MYEVEDIPLETTEGYRRSSTTGDRLMVALAALALVGGGLIAVTRLMPAADPQISEASATPAASASRTPRPTPTPRPMRSFALAGGVPQEIPGPEPTFYGWIQVLRETPVYGSTTPSGTVVGSLQAGDVAFGSTAATQSGDGPTWLRLDAPMTGWIPESDHRGRVVERYGESFAEGTYVDRLTAGDGRFVIVGSEQHPYGEYSSFLAVSTDGRRWTRVESDRFAGHSVVQAAYGPAGWLLMTGSDGDPAGASNWMWQSADGLDWQPLGPMSAARMGVSGPPNLVGSRAGYVLFDPYETGDRTAWYSADGLLWSERPLPNLAADVMVATSLGFYLYASDPGNRVGAFSADGWSWIRVEHPGDMAGLRGVAALGDRLVALAETEEGVGSWEAVPQAGGLDWLPAADGGSFKGGNVAAVASGDGPMAVAFGTDAAGRATSWANDGGRWSARAVPDDVKAVAFNGATTASGTVAIVMEPSLINWRPVVWGVDGQGTWRAAQPPLVEERVLTERDCRATGTSLLDLMTTPPPVTIACFGDAPIILEAYVADCEGCYGDQGGILEPGWLAEPTEVVELMPFESNGYGSLTSVLRPRLQYDRAWVGKLVRVTGHLNDPAAQRCRLTETPDDASWYPYAADLVRECQSRFVVTQIAVVQER